jgi:hypothetical protein
MYQTRLSPATSRMILAAGYQPAAITAEMTSGPQAGIDFLNDDDWATAILIRRVYADHPDWVADLFAQDEKTNPNRL